MSTDHSIPSKPRRRWFQFSLRTLFVLLTVLCVWLGVTANRARKQREAVAAIEAVGGVVRYRYQLSATRNEREQYEFKSNKTRLCSIAFKLQRKREIT